MNQDVPFNTIDDLLDQLQFCPADWAVQLLVPEGSGVIAAHKLADLLIDRRIIEDHGVLSIMTGELIARFTVADLARLRPHRR